MNSQKRRQKGAVSLFLVIFVALLIVTIATAFIRIMIQDQAQATANDLSKSALDSANAGVEDAKRAIVEYYSLVPAKPNPAAGSVKPDCSTVPDGANNRCDELRKALVGSTTPPNDTDGWTTNCHATKDAGVATLSQGETGEVLVKSGNDADNQLNQAYTCLNIQMNPHDIIGSLLPNESKFINLKTTGNATFTKIKIQWYKKSPTQTTLNLGSSPYELTKTWPAERPAVLRTQLLQYRSEFQLSDFDKAGINNNNLTLFLLPSSIPSLTTSAFANDLRQDQTSNAAQPVSCSLAGNFACEVTIDLPCAGGDCTDYSSGLNIDRKAYLKLSQFYSANNTDYRITGIDKDGGEVRFDTQPVVDSTGRANDIFRRVRSRIDLGVSSIPNVEAAVDVTRSLCKDFVVTNNDSWFPNALCPKPTPSP